MLLSPDQVKRFWNKQTGWPAIIAAKKWTKEEAETERKAMLQRAGFTSLTLVDPVHGFTRVLRELDALRDNLGGMLHHTDEENTRRTLIHNIIGLGFPDEYIWPLCRDRFGTREWQTLPLPKLQQLHITLVNRARAKKKKAPSIFPLLKPVEKAPDLEPDPF